MQSKAKKKTEHTISTGSGIHSFYCRKRKHLQWQCWEKRSIVSQALTSLFCRSCARRHSLPFKKMSFHFIFIRRAELSTSPMCYVLRAYQKLPVVLYTCMEPCLLPRSLFFFLFHFVNNQSTRSNSHVAQTMNNFLHVFSLLIQANQLFEILLRIQFIEVI